MLWAAMLCAFFGFMRVSEFTSAKAKSFSSEDTLCYTDVKVIDSNCFGIQLKSSKTDPFRLGVQIRIAANGLLLCPVTALRKYMQSRKPSVAPLFGFSNGHYLTRQAFARAIHGLLPEHANISTHSFRIGAATTAAAMGLPRWLIKNLGRWNSDCFRQYIRIPGETITKVSASLSQHAGTAQQFDPDLA